MIDEVKLNSAMKKSITNDWLACFNGMASVRPMWLMKRHGPIVVGICLERNRSNDSYVPIFHLHNLLVPSSSVVLSAFLAVPDERNKQLARVIRAGHHAEKHLAAASWLADALPVLKSSVLTWTQVVEMYCQFVTEKRDYAVARYGFPIFRDLIMAAGWCGHYSYARSCMEWATSLLESRDPPMHPIITSKAWIDSVGRFGDKDYLDSVVQSELKAHKLEALPCYEFDPDASSDAPSIIEAYGRAGFR